MVVVEELPMEMEEVSSKLVKTNKKPKEAKAPKAPAAALEKIKKSQKFAKEKKEAAASAKRGVVLVQHLPHGFFEEELVEFFSQFGRVYRTKLFRSRKTGVSKGYAFVEFAIEDVAKIAAEAMNNYLMFNKLIKCRVLENVKNTHQLFGNIVTAEEPREYREARRQQHYKNGPGLSKREYMEKRLVELNTVKDKLSALEVDWSFEDIEKPFRAELESVIQKGGDDALKRIQKEPLKAKDKVVKAKKVNKNKSELRKAAVAEELAAGGDASNTIKVSTPKTPTTKAAVTPVTPKIPLSTPKGKSPKATPVTVNKTKSPAAVPSPKPATPKAKQELVTPKGTPAKSTAVKYTPGGKSPALAKVDKNTTPASKKTPQQAQSVPASTLRAQTPIKADTPAKPDKQKTPKAATPVQKSQTPIKTPTKVDSAAVIIATPKLDKQKTPKVQTPVQKLQTPKKTPTKVESPVIAKATPQPEKLNTPKIKQQTPKKAALDTTPVPAATEDEQPQRKKKKSLPKVSPKMLRSRAKQELLSTPAPETVASPAKTPKQKRVQEKTEPKASVEDSKTPAKRRKSMFAGSKPVDSPKPFAKFSPKMLRSRGNVTPSSVASPAVKPKGRKSVM